MVDDSIVSGFFRDEFRKIPFLFRFGRKTVIAFIVIIALILSADLILFNYMRRGMELNTLAFRDKVYESIPIASYSSSINLFIFISATIVVIMVLWMLIAKFFEKKAYARASKLAAEYELYEQRKTRDEYRRILEQAEKE